MTIENPAFCLALYLTGVHFQGELQHVGHVGEEKIKWKPIKTHEIDGLWLHDELYAEERFENFCFYWRIPFKRILMLTDITKFRGVFFCEVKVF